MTQPMVNYQEADPVSVASRLREGRENLDLTRKQVAERTGIPLKSIENIETGRQEPTLSRVKVLSRLYGIDPDDILNEVDAGDDERPKAPAAPKAGNDLTGNELAKLRSEIEKLAKAAGMTVQHPGDEGDPGEGASTVVSDQPDDGSGDRQVKDAVISFAKFVEDNGPNAQTVPRKVRRMRKFLEGVTIRELKDAANELDVDMDTLPDPEAADVTHDRLRKIFVDRILATAVYGVDIAELSVKALDRLVEDVHSDSSALGLGFFDDPLMAGQELFEKDKDFRARALRELPALLVEVAENRSAPDLENKRRYPRVGGSARG